jgi:beta-lactamase class A
MTVRMTAVTGFLLLLLGVWSWHAIPSDDWKSRLAAEIEAIDEAMTGNFGVYIHHLGEDQSLRHNTDRYWYLSSTVKVPLAVAVLQKVEEGEWSLDQEIVLEESDYVDGAGDMLWHEAGESFSVQLLLEKSIRLSDSTATDMLIRLLGEDELNRQIRDDMIAQGFGPITTILQVRYDAYSEVHPDARNLSNRDFIDLKTVNTSEERYRMLLEKLDIGPDEANARNDREAFERYYERGINSASLEAFGTLLARLVRGELLNAENTGRLLGFMENITTGDNRIIAGLPADTVFAQKTGTQIARACNVGAINPRSQEHAVIVAACAERFDQLSEAEAAFKKLGQALDSAGIVQ